MSNNKGTKFEVRGLINGGTDWDDLGSFPTGTEARMVADEVEADYPAGLEVWYGDQRVMYYTAVAS
jgi:hypothetical protein